MVDEIYFRHERLRAHQSELLKDSYASVSNRKHLLAHAVTGLGKTDATVGAALTHALRENLTVFFLTPKISQHRIALDVVRGIENKYHLGLRAVDMVGRRYACIDDTLGDLDHDGFYYSCQKKRTDETCEFYGNARGYNPLGEAKANQRFEKMLQGYGPSRTHHQLIQLGEEHYSCPYEWMIKLAALSNVIIADYFHLLVPSIRDIFLKKIKKDIRKSIVIVDEGHNLARRVREHLSSTINSFILRKAEKEMHLLGVEKIPLERAFNAWCEEQLKNQDEALLSSASLHDFLHSLNLKSDECAGYFEHLGSVFIERTSRRSACLKLSKFIAEWEGDGPGIVRILRKRSNGFFLSKRFLDPSKATSLLNQAHASIVMSGTLLPLEMHRDILGMEKNRSILKQYPSPFDDQRQIHIIADNVTTRYSQRTFENYQQMAASIDRIVQCAPPGIALFFPSYTVMNAVVPLMQSAPLLLQKERMNSKEVAALIRRFQAGRHVLCAVQGGSLAEGIDYSNQEIQTAVIVGVALDEMSLEVKALIDYYEDKFGQGWNYGYLYPGIIKALQAAGRGIRKESDRLAVVFMDERFKWKNYRTLLGKKSFIVTAEPEKYVEEFWREQDVVHRQIRA